MEFPIADTFTDSLARLTGDEQKAVKTTAFDLQLNPANPGMSPRPRSRTATGSGSESPRRIGTSTQCARTMLPEMLPQEVEIRGDHGIREFDDVGPISLL